MIRALRLRDCVGRLRTVKHLADTKIDQFRVLVLPKDDVLRLDVSVQDTALVAEQ